MLRTDEPIHWEGRTFFGGDEIGFTDDGSFVLGLYSTEPAPQRGTYFTSLPISDKPFRKLHPTKAAVRDDGDALTIFCDWGRAYRLGASRQIIEALIAEAKEHDVPVQKDPSHDH